MNVWHDEPAFPASELNPDEKRVRVGDYLVDCGAHENPTLAEVEAVLAPPGD